MISCLTTSTWGSTPTTVTPSQPPSSKDAPLKTTDASTTSRSHSPSTTSPDSDKVADALDVAVSTGEQDWDRWRFRDVIQLGNPDILQPDILGASGPSEILKIYTLATTHNKPIMPTLPRARASTASHPSTAYSTIKNAIRPPRILNRIRTAFGSSRRTLRRSRRTD